MQILVQTLIILWICATSILSECNVCQRSNFVACHKENVYSLCINDVPTRDFITCPENYVCTDGPYVCYPRLQKQPSCSENKNLCGVCSNNKVYACVNETTIAFCYGQDEPVEGAEVSYCLGDTVCDIYSTKGFCTESYLVKPSCVTQIKNGTDKVTTEPTTTIEISTTTTEESTTTSTTMEPTTTINITKPTTTINITKPTTTTTTTEPTTNTTTNTTTKPTTTSTTTTTTTTEPTTTTTTTEPTTTTTTKTTTKPTITSTTTTESTTTTTTTEPTTTTTTTTTTKPSTTSTTTTESTTATTTKEPTTTTTTTEPTTTTTTTTTSTTTTESTTTTTTTQTPPKPRDPNTICKDAGTTGSYYADDPSCTTFIVCYIMSGSIYSLKKSCPSGQYFPPGGQKCEAVKPDVCI